MGWDAFFAPHSVDISRSVPLLAIWSIEVKGYRVRTGPADLGDTTWPPVSTSAGISVSGGKRMEGSRRRQVDLRSLETLGAAG